LYRLDVNLQNWLALTAFGSSFVPPKSPRSVRG